MNDDQFTSFPANCALGLLTVNRAKSSVIGNIGTTASCLACKNGYKPEFDSSRFFIIGCVEIANCDTTSTTSGWFDGCKTCAANHSHKYNKNTKLIDYDTCVESSIANCMAFDDVDDTCVECKKNHVFVDSKRTCDAIKPQNCENFNLLNFNSFNKVIKYNDLSKAFYLLSDEGCNSCSSGFINIRTEETLETCVTSPFVEANAFPDDNSSFDPNCISYYLVEGQILCRTCAATYIPTLNSQECKSATDFPNCQIAANTGTFCSRCNDSHALVGNVCTEKTIPNCAEYSNTLTSLTCLVCADTFILKSNECAEGTINNCKTYTVDSNNNEKCVDCLDNFVLVTPSGQGQQCMPIPGDLNCQKAELINNNGELSCTVCSPGNGFSTTANDLNNNTCVNADTINNCSKYDIQDPLNNSTFACIECTNEFYLSGNSCVERDNLPGCAVFKKDANVCEECSDNYLFNDEGVCEILNVGILNCSLYQNDTTCLECFTKFYLSEDGGACNEVPEANLYDNCIAWSSETDCSACDPGYWLETPQKCTFSEAQDCLTYESLTACSNCVPGWFLEANAQQGITSCVPSTIDNCNIFVLNENKCSECSGDFVTNEVGDCIQVATPIQDCKVYDNTTSNCKICNPLTILSTDGKTCVPATGLTSFTSCSQMKYRSEPVCVACNPGYFFNNGQCTDCADGVNTRSGCLYCDYNLPKRCLVCKSSYWMNSLGNCVFNQSLRVAIKNDISESSSILSTLVFALMSIFVFNL